MESPFIELGQISTVIYFAYFLIIMPLISLFENSLLELKSIGNNNKAEVYNENVVMATFALQNQNKLNVNSMFTKIALLFSTVLLFIVNIGSASKIISCDAPRP
ncbi:MAG: hypothetical protein EOP34_09235 [Rickettsiales bacterium]|nr:MAG: hypothetical protein EOP34_09235 [Rickettsiales bacterium]